MKPALLITLDAVKRDATLQPGYRGARKLLVTELYTEREVETREVVWSPPTGLDKCPVQVTANIEVAIFTQQAAQERHHHKLATEFYTVLAGRMIIEVEGLSHALAAGDMIVINPGTVHRVQPEGCEFLCQIISANCGGAADRHLDQPLLQVIDQGQ